MLSLVEQATQLHSPPPVTFPLKMLRRAAATLWRTNLARGLATPSAAVDEAAAKTGKESFLEVWQQHAPEGLSPPMFASDWVKKKEVESEGEKDKTSALPSKLTLNFYLPSGEICSGEQVRDSQGW